MIYKATQQTGTNGRSVLFESYEKLSPSQKICAASSPLAYSIVSLAALNLRVRC